MLVESNGKWWIIFSAYWYTDCLCWHKLRLLSDAIFKILFIYLFVNYYLFIWFLGDISYHIGATHMMLQTTFTYTTHRNKCGQNYSAYYLKHCPVFLFCWRWFWVLKKIFNDEEKQTGGQNLMLCRLSATSTCGKALRIFEFCIILPVCLVFLV